MEYEVEYDVHGGVPECGAIFMSNVSTKRECFRRKLLGLPSAQANFVKQIRAGMVLFLFEFERRELYGVFRACSDGSTNIVPHAFTSSGKQFPAQVRFTPIWHCNPLSEHEFQDAIKENYFANKKFNFGLSEVQVRRLLCLFSSRKLQKPQRPISKQASKLMGKERSIAGDDDDDDYSLRNRAEKFVEGDRLVSRIDAKYPGKCSSNNGRRLDGNRFMESEVIKNDHKVNGCQGYAILTKPPSASSGKRRRDDDDDDSFAMQDTIAYHDFDHGLGRIIHIEQPGDSDKSERLAEENKFSLTKRMMGSNIGPIATPKYSWESLAKVGRATDDGKFSVGEDKCTPDHGFGLVTSTPENSGSKARRASDDRGFFEDYGVDNDYNSETYPKPVFSDDRCVNTLGRLRTSDEGVFFGNDRTEIEQYADNTMGGGRKESEDYKFVRSDRAVPSEHFANRLDFPSRENDHYRFLAGVSKENAHNINSRYPPAKIRRASDEGIIKKTGRLDSAYNMQNSFGFPTFPASTNLCQSRQNPSFFSSEPNLQTKISLCQDQPKHRSAVPPMDQKTFDFSCPISHDAVVTRTVPYDPEVPRIHRRNQSSFVDECTSCSVQDFPPHHSSDGNLFTASSKRSLPYRSQAEDLGQHLDVASGYGNKVPLPTSPNYYALSGFRTSRSPSSAEYHPKMEAKATGQEVYEGSLSPESTPAFPPYSRSNMYERQNANTFIESDKHALSSQGRYEHGFPQNENSRVFRVDDASFTSNAGHLHFGSSREKSNTCDTKNSYHNPKGMPTDSKSKRTSVFARLTPASEVGVEQNDSDFLVSAEEEINYDLQYDECDMGASVDQVMDTLYDSLDHHITKVIKSSLVRKHDMECDKLKMSTLKIEHDAEHVIDENCDEIAEETRVVSFKRRSETKKNKDGAKAKSSVDNSEYEREGSGQKSVREGSEGKQHKRRKLVRTAFGKTEQLNEGLSSDGSPNLQLSSFGGYDKDGIGNLDDSVKNQIIEQSSSLISTLVQLTALSACEGTNANIEQSTYCGRKKSETYERIESFDGSIKRASTSNVLESSREGFNAKESTGSCLGLSRSHGSDNIAQNVGVMHVTNPTICEAGNTNSDSSNRKERNAVTSAVSLTSDGGKNGITAGPENGIEDLMA